MDCALPGGGAGALRSGCLRRDSGLGRDRSGGGLLRRCGLFRYRGRGFFRRSLRGNRLRPAHRLRGGGGRRSAGYRRRLGEDRRDDHRDFRGRWWFLCRWGGERNRLFLVCGRRSQGLRKGRSLRGFPRLRQGLLQGQANGGWLGDILESHPGKEKEKAVKRCAHRKGETPPVHCPPPWRARDALSTPARRRASSTSATLP